MNNPQEQMRVLIRRCPYDSIHRDRIVNDLLGLSTSYHFIVKLVDQVDGVRVGLLCSLEGNLPVTIVSQVYHIPMSIVFPEKYPAIAPMLYVCPTPNMNIRPSQYVNARGQISHQSLSTWTMKSSLRLVLTELSTVFGQQCPVYINANYQIQTTAIDTANRRILDMHERMKNEVAEECKWLESTKYRLLDHQSQLESDLKTAVRLSQASKDKRTLLDAQCKLLEEKLLSRAYRPPPEEAVPSELTLEPKDPLQTQMLHLISEELAVSDTIFFLEEMMNKRHTASEGCLKELKSMYMKQFLVWKKEEKLERVIGTRR